MPLSDDELAALIRREIDEAEGYDHDVLAEKRANAMDFYQGRMPDPSDGRSDMISYDVADCVNAVLSQATDVFSGSMVEFVPANEEDEQQAQLESDATRAVIDQEGAWSILSESCFDALLIGNGWIKVWVEEREDITRESYEGIDDIALYEVMQPTAEMQTVEITDQDAAGEGLIDVDIKRTTILNTLKVESIAPENMLFSQSYSQLEFQDIRFVAERKLYTTSDLREMGISQDVIDQIPYHTENYWVAVTARQGQYDESTDDQLGGKQEASRLREVFDCYFRVALDDGSETELRHIMLGGREILENEPAGWIPFCTGSPIPWPHRIAGIGLFERLHDIQSGKTVILRNYMDNLELMNSSRTAFYEGEVNQDDLENSRTDGTIRCKVPPAQAIMPMPVNPVGSEVIQGLNYLDSVREQRGGASIELNEGQMQVAKSSVMAASGVQQRAEQSAAWYCSNLANTLMKGMFYLTHRTLRTGKIGQIDAKRRGKWERVDPSQWQERKNCRVDVGLTTGEKQQRKIDLQQLIQLQQGMLAQGGEGIITDKQKTYNSIADWIRATAVGPPEEYLIDPESEEAQQAMQQQAQQQQMQQQQMQQMQQQLEAFERWKHDTELQFKYYDTNLDNSTDLKKAGLDAEVEEAKMTANAIVEMEKANAAGAGETGNGRAANGAG